MYDKKLMLDNIHCEYINLFDLSLASVQTNIECDSSVVLVWFLRVTAYCLCLGYSDVAILLPIAREYLDCVYVCVFLVIHEQLSELV